jgi:peptidoglycan/xylan/chitin deacetylase (PgdA/CDA1 family)
MKFVAKEVGSSAIDIAPDRARMMRQMVFGAISAAFFAFAAGPVMAQSTDVATDAATQETPQDTAQETPQATSENATEAVETPGSDMPTKAAPEPALVDVTGDATSAVVFMYHRFGEGDYPSTNIALDQFKAHIAELTSGAYTVMGVPQIVSTLEAGNGLPDRAVGITIDDAYRSVYELAWPIFRENNIPFTVFVSTEQLDDGFSNYMTWDMVRDLSKAGVTIGGHSQHHSHLPEIGIDAVKAELAHSAERFEQELGYIPEIFAYPYGEANAEVIAAVKDAGYKAAFGQQSGAMSTESDFMYLPRFALNEHYGALDRFKLAANSLPLRVTDITPSDYTLTRNPPAFGFTLKEPAPNVACYPSDGTATMTRLGDERVEIRLDGPVSSGRWRINCTALGAGSRWHWFGMLYTVP